MAAAPFLVLFNEEVIQRLKEEHAPPPFDRINDVAVSVPTAEMVRRHFPQVPVYARARNHHHTHLLTVLGIKSIVREILYSSLKLTEAALKGLGQPAHETRALLERFQRQFAVFRDETRLIQTTREAAEKFKRLFEENSQSEPAGKPAA